MINNQTGINFYSNPLVSVIIPSYNRYETVRRTIESVLAQKCDFPFEIIIGDDKSEDNVRDLLKSFQNKYPEIIRLLFHEENLGLGANWAKCVQECKGKYIANCDDDDYWHNSEKLQLQVDFLENNSDFGVCHTDFRDYYKQTGKVIEEKVSDITYNIPLYKAIFEGKFKFCNSTVIYRKELIDKYIKLEDYIDKKFNLQDWMTLLIIAKYSGFYCLPVSTTTLSIDNSSITRPKSFEKLEARMKVEEECYRYVCDIFNEELKYDETEYKKYTYKIFINYAYLYNDFKTAKKYGIFLEKLNKRSVKVMFTKNVLLFKLYAVWFKWTQNYKF